jgi:cytochrome P450
LRRKDTNERKIVMNAPDQTVPEEAMLSLLSGASAELVANPFPLFAHMRSMGAVLPIPFPLAGTDRRARAVTRMEEAVQILKDHAHFTVDSGSIGVNNLFGQNNARTAETSGTPTFLTAKTMLTVDEPDHRRLRGLVSKVFTRRYIESLRPRVQQIADELLDLVQEQGQMDLVGDYAFPLPINVISEMLGCLTPTGTRSASGLRRWRTAWVWEGMSRGSRLTCAPSGNTPRT